MNKAPFRKNKEEYGEKYDEHLFEQYKAYIDSAEKISDRRHNANNYFITINTFLISFLGLSFRVQIIEDLEWIKTLMALVGVIICVIFWFLIRSYKQMNTGKFRVIHEIEQRLPLALYHYEWEILKKGEEKSVYYPFSHIELLIPWVFGIIYVIMGIVFVC